MIGTVIFSFRLRNANSTARRHVRLACKKKHVDGRDVGKDLPGGGYLLPNPILVEAGFLYGPGKLGFAMFKHGSDSEVPQMKLVPYDAGHPPVCLDEDGKTISVDLADGTIYEAEVVDKDASIDSKLLASGNIAGMLPAASPDSQSVNDSESDANQQSEKLFVGGQSSPRRTLKISFTCNKCGSRNVRSVNPLAWHSGTVFLQCAGCSVHHKMVDNLNLTTEFESGTDTSVVDMQKEIARLDRLRITRSLMPDRMRPIEPQEEVE